MSNDTSSCSLPPVQTAPVSEPAPFLTPDASLSGEMDLVGSVRVPGEGGKLSLFKRGEEFSLRVHGTELMNSRVHESEDALARLAASKLAGIASPVFLIGGLGMGYTLAAALKGLDAGAKVVVAELVSQVVAWNRGPLGHLAGHPLDDPRVALRETDVAKILQTEQEAYHAILLDVDNGPEGVVQDSNDWLYTEDGLWAAFTALRPGGLLAVWSAGPDRAFLMRLRKIGFETEEVRIRVQAPGCGSRDTIWLAKRPA